MRQKKNDAICLVLNEELDTAVSFPYFAPEKDSFRSPAFIMPESGFVEDVIHDIWSHLPRPYDPDRKDIVDLKYSNMFLPQQLKLLHNWGDSQTCAILRVPKWIGAEVDPVLADDIYLRGDQAQAQEFFMKLKQGRLLRKCGIFPLRFYLDTHLRKLAIKLHFKSKVAPTIPQEILDDYDKSGLGDNTYQNVRYAFGFISGYKPKLINEYENSKLFWFSVLNNDAGLSFLEGNIDLTERTQIFEGNPTLTNKKQKHLNLIHVFTDDQPHISIRSIC